MGRVGRATVINGEASQSAMESWTVVPLVGVTSVWSAVVALARQLTGGQVVLHGAAQGQVQGPWRTRAAFLRPCGVREHGDVAIVEAARGTWLRLGRQAYGVVGVVGVAGKRSAQGFCWIAE